MSFAEAQNRLKNYLLIVLMLIVAWFFSGYFLDIIQTRIADHSDHARTLFILMNVVTVFSLGFFIYELAKPTSIPSFVLAIFFGMVSRNALMLFMDSQVAMFTMITIGAVYILFEGGLEIPFQKFKTLMGPILSISFLGTFITAILFAIWIVPLGAATGVYVSLPIAVLLGAALASTDPAAIIPSFKSLLFLHPRVKHIAVSESAITDVLGAVMVTVFLSLFLQGVAPVSVLDAYRMLITTENLLLITRVIGMGVLVGVFGFFILSLWNKWKARVQTEGECDSALFLALPLLSFTFAEVLGGSGYLAVFLSSLMFHIQSHFRHVQNYFNSTVEAFMKPLIFMLLGAMVDLGQLWEYAPIGILSGAIFLFVLRPVTVFVTLIPFNLGSHKFSLKELAFLSFVRETGVIPAALLITISVAGIDGSEVLLAVGLWIILLSLLIEPPLTPRVAKALGVAKDNLTVLERKHVGPVAVLCSRGYSFPERMKTVVQWASEHEVDNIALLHCPEERYSKVFVADVQHRADELFNSINEELRHEGKHEINFEFLCGPGLLQDNIESIIAGGDVSIIFVGAKMLDYRMEDVKRLNVPFYFMS